MASAHLTRHILHSPADLMALVADVEAYPEFINLLSALRVKNRTQVTPSHERFEAEATVSYKFISEIFSSIVNVYDEDKKRLSVTKANRSGAVKDLRNDWIFHELSDGSTLVEFIIEVKLKAYPLELLLRDKFDRAGNKMMELFTAKAAHTCPKIGSHTLDMRAEYKRLGLDYALA